MQVKRAKIESEESIFDLLGFLFKGFRDDQGIPLENDATRNINSYFMKFVDDEEKWFLRKTCQTLRAKGVLEIKRKELVSVCNYAAGEGFLTLLKWVCSGNCVRPWDKWTCARAAEGGHLETLKWLRSQDPPCPWNDDTCARAARWGKLKTLKWLRSQDPPCPWFEPTMCCWAAYGGNLKVLKWLRSQNPPCSWDRAICVLSVRWLHLDILRYAIENECPGYREFIKFLE